MIRDLVYRWAMWKSSC